MDDIGAITETAGAAALEIAVSAVRERGGKVGPCPNCASPMFAAYCAICGQPANIHRRSVFGLVHDFVSDIASFDSRILRTALALMFRPGELSLAFREGRTQRFVPAVRLYLFVSLIFFVTLSAAGIALLQLELVNYQTRYVADKDHNVYVVTKAGRVAMDGFKADDKGNIYLADKDTATANVALGMKANGELNNNITTVPHFFSKFGTVHTQTAAQSTIVKMLDKDAKDKESKSGKWSAWISQHVSRMLRALASNPAAVNEPLTAWIPRILFILLPLFALLLACFYWRQRKSFYFVDHLVFSLNYHAFGFVFLLIAAGLAQFLPGNAVAAFVLIGLSLYLLVAMRRFYRQSWFWTGTKFAFVGLFYLCFLLPTLLTVLVISLWHI